MPQIVAFLPFLGAILAPLALAAVQGWPAARPLAWRMLPLAPLPALALALLAPVPSQASDDWLLMGATLGLTETGRLFLIFTTLLWAAAGAAARQWLRDDPRATGFALGFLLAQSGNIGLILAQDAAGFYGAFALMSFAAYGLVLHSRSDPARAAARLYIGFVVAGELALFAGLSLAAGQAGSILLADLRTTPISDMAAALLIAGFAIKLGIMPLHLWLPPAHGAAPVPASAVLSGAMIKAGLYGMIVVLPLGVQAYGDHGTALMAAGLVTIFAAALLGVQQGNAKVVLGFSSVSQMGIMALGLGAALTVPAAWPAILPVLVFLAAHHALAKGALFLGTGAFAAQAGRGGRGVMTLLLLAPALVLAGLPPGSGSLGKEALKTALAQGSQVWLPWLVVALTLSGIATTLLMARFLALLWRAPPAAPAPARPEALALPFAGLAAAALALPVLWPVLAGPMAAPLALAGGGAVWPILLAVALALGAAIRAHAQQVGPARLARQIAAPALRLRSRIAGRLAARRRAARRLAQAVPARIAAVASDWRAGQTAIAGLIVLVLLIEGVASLAPGSAGARPTPITPAEVPSRPVPAGPQEGGGPGPDPAPARTATPSLSPEPEPEPEPEP